MTPAEGIEYLKKLSTDEPVFILRAQDKFAPSTVTSWAAVIGAITSIHKEDQEWIARARLKSSKALELADEMRQWQIEHQAKIPD